MFLSWLISVVIILTSTVQFEAHAAQVKILEGDALYVDPNTDVQVTCNVDDLRGKTVKWTLDGEDIGLVAAGKTVVFVDPSYKTKYNITGAEASGGNFTLVIKNVSDSDVGSIGCEVSNANPAQLFLRIHESISKVVASYYSEGSSEIHLNGKPFVHVHPHKYINLTCTAPQVRPRPSVTWYWKNLRKSDTQLEQVTIDETKTNLHDNKIYNFSSTLQINADFVQTLIEARNPATKVETTTSAMEEATSTAATASITEVGVTVVTDEELVEDSPSALLQQASFDEKIQVVCVVDQMGEQLQKSFNLHIGPMENGVDSLFCGSTIFIMMLTQFLLFNIFTSFENFV